MPERAWGSIPQLSAKPQRYAEESPASEVFFENFTKWVDSVATTAILTHHNRRHREAEEATGERDSPRYHPLDYSPFVKGTGNSRSLKGVWIAEGVVAGSSA